MWIFWDEKNTVSNYTYKWIFGKKKGRWKFLDFWGTFEVLGWDVWQNILETTLEQALAQANLLAQSIRFRRVVESAKELKPVTYQKVSKPKGLHGIFWNYPHECNMYY